MPEKLGQNFFFCGRSRWGMTVSGGIILGLNIGSFVSAVQTNNPQYIEPVSAATCGVAVFAQTFIFKAFDKRLLLISGIVGIWSTKWTILRYLENEKFNASYNRYKHLFLKEGEEWWDPHGAYFPDILGKMILFKSFSSFMVLMPVTIAQLHRFPQPIGVTCKIGLISLVSGFVIEMLADWEKWKCRREDIYETFHYWTDGGIFRYCQYPDVLGELLFWSGLSVLATPAIVGFARIWAFISPLYLSSLLIYFGGMSTKDSMRDKIFESDEKYNRYKAVTPLIIPWIPLKKPPKKYAPIFDSIGYDILEENAKNPSKIKDDLFYTPQLPEDCHIDTKFGLK
eukprot:GHVL01010006.1.p1 GENE.GHVL01010006.1~~GHVL01010006.1.p1  ORF type:complete len:340 (+),score=76.32 GHVL01010006.1:49-1068(+)